MTDSLPRSRPRRILLKLSGEALMGSREFGYDADFLSYIATELESLAEYQVALVVGGGNLFRGARDHGLKVERVTGDSMGMLATLMNALALRDSLRQQGLRAEVLSAFAIAGICVGYDRQKADRLLSEGVRVIFAGGTGNPYFTTDTAASLRAVEIGADLLVKATQVDGVFSADPLVHADVHYYPELTYTKVLSDGLKVMDATAIALCQENRMPIRILSIHNPGALAKVLAGESIGSLVRSEDGHD